MKGWRTIIWNAAFGVLTVIVPLAAYLSSFNWSGIVSQKTALVIALAMNVINIAGNIVLRALTDTPIGKSE